MIMELLTKSDTSVAVVAETLKREIIDGSTSSVIDVCTKVNLPSGLRAKVVAGLWAHGAKSREVLAKVIDAQPEFASAQTLKRAAELLDAPRKMRKLERLLAAHCRPGRRKRLREELAKLQAENVPPHFSASRSFYSVVKRQLRKLPADRLEFDLLFYAEGPWKSLCNLAHSAPSEWKLPFFQPTIFGAEPPANSLLADARGLTPSNLVILLEKHPQLATAGYSYIRSKLNMSSLPAEAKTALVARCPLGDIIWHYEELRSGAATDKVVEERLDELDAGQMLQASSSHFDTGNYAKIVERLLTFRHLKVSFWERLMPLAERLLDELKSRRVALVRSAGIRSLQALAAQAVDAMAEPVALPEAVALSLPTEPSLRVAVLGDASASMQTAINSACIAGAMFTAIFEADLVFFNSKAFRASLAMPSNTDEVLKVTEEVRANSCTSPAAALAEFYEKKQAIDLFLVVSDEGENTGHKGLRFAPLFKKYTEEIYPGARCIFISFLRDGDPGTMLREMERAGFSSTPQYRFDVNRPDLAKFDSLLGSILLDARQQLDQLALAPRLESS